MKSNLPKILLILLFPAAVLVSACEHTLDVQPLTPDFASIQANILTPGCVNRGCHPGGGAPMSLAEGVAYGNLVNAPSSIGGILRVKPGDPENSLLYLKLIADPRFPERMPSVGAPLSDEQIEAVRQWIADGAPPPSADGAAVHRLEILAEDDKVEVGATLALQVRAFDRNDNVLAFVEIQWSSSNTSVATVDENGTVTGVNVGDAKITAAAGNASASIDIRVEESDLRARFSSIQESILTPSCAVANCHLGSTAQLGLNLQQGSAYGNLVNVASRQNGAFLRVKPGDAANSYLYMKLIGDSRASGDRMPQGSAPLSDSQLDVIRDWINAGAENN